MIEILVGNIGTVFEGEDVYAAYDVWCDYKKQASSLHGRASMETVTYLVDGEIRLEFSPELDLSTDQLAKLHGLTTFDTAIPLAWFKRACELVSENINGHVVWDYTNDRFGKPYGLTELGRNAIMYMENPTLNPD